MSGKHPHECYAIHLCLTSPHVEHSLQLFVKLNIDASSSEPRSQTLNPTMCSPIWRGLQFKCRTKKSMKPDYEKYILWTNTANRIWEILQEELKMSPACAMMTHNAMQFKCSKCRNHSSFASLCPLPELPKNSLLQPWQLRRELLYRVFFYTGPPLVEPAWESWGTK